MRLKKLYYLFFLPGILAYQPALPQEQPSDSLVPLLSCLEHYYGTDGLLANGRLYDPANTRAARHPYFLADEWAEGAVYVKGKCFSSLYLKYNLETGQLILKQELQNGASANVALTKVLVDSFRIGPHFFVNQSLLAGPVEGPPFIERIYSGEASLYRVQKKTFINTYSSRTPYGKFSDPETTFFLEAGGEFREAPNRQAFLDFFSPHQKSVKRQMKQQGIRLKKATASELARLMEYCDKLE